MLTATPSFGADEVIRLCVDPDWLPYEAISEDGEHIGIAADIIKLIGERSKVEFALHKTADWSESLSNARDGSCDGLSFLNWTAAREEWLTFSNPVFVDPNVLIGRLDRQFISNLKSEGAVTLALPKGTSIEQWIRRDYPEVRLVFFKTEFEALQAVSRGEADLTLRSVSIAMYEIRKHGFANLTVVGSPPGYDNAFRIGVVKSRSSVIDQINLGISRILPGEIRDITNRHVSIAVVIARDYRSTVIAIVVLGSILAFAIYLTLKFRKMNNLLLVSEKKFSTAFALSPSPMLITRYSTGQILDANEKCLKMFSLSRDEMVGKSTVDIGIFDTLEARNRFVSDYKFEPSETPEALRFINKDGVEKFVEVSISRFNLSSDDLLMVALHDVTEQRHLFDEVTFNASHDALTGLRNRFGAFAELEELEAETRHRNEHLALLMIDIDWFKVINDRYGHPQGDAVLAVIARKLNDVLPPTSRVYRWGGEEFLVAYVGQTRDEAQAMAEKIRISIETYDFEKVGHLTVSIGVAFLEAGQSVTTTLTRADKALYDEKAGGRNQCCIG